MRSDIDGFNKPEGFYTSKRALRFIETITNSTLADLIIRFEAFCIGGLDSEFHISILLQRSDTLNLLGLIGNANEQLQRLKTQTSDLILRKLRK